MRRSRRVSRSSPRSPGSSGRRTRTKTFSPVYIAGTDWYFAMSFVYDYGGTIAVTNKGKWIGTLDRPKALAGLAAFKRFFDAASRASKTTDEVRPESVRRLCPGQRCVDARPGLVQLLRRRLQESHRAVRDAESHEGPADSGFPRRLGPRGPGRCQQGAGCLMDLGLHRQRVDDRDPRDGEHPEHDEPARHQRERARGPQELVRADREELGQRRERKHPPDDAVADPDWEDDRSRKPRTRRATTSPSRSTSGRTYVCRSPPRPLPTGLGGDRSSGAFARRRFPTS